MALTREDAVSSIGADSTRQGRPGTRASGDSHLSPLCLPENGCWLQLVLELHINFSKWMNSQTWNQQIMGVLPLILAPASPPPTDLLTEVSGGGGREMPGHRRGSHRRPIFVQEAVVGDSGGLSCHLISTLEKWFCSLCPALPVCVYSWGWRGGPGVGFFNRLVPLAGRGPGWALWSHFPPPSARQAESWDERVNMGSSELCRSKQRPGLRERPLSQTTNQLPGKRSPFQ